MLDIELGEAIANLRVDGVLPLLLPRNFADLGLERVEPRVERLPLSGKGTQTALELVHDPMLIGMKEARLEAVSERAVRPMKETLGP